jgi:hypothetical protein
VLLAYPPAGSPWPVPSVAKLCDFGDCAHITPDLAVEPLLASQSRDVGGADGRAGSRSPPGSRPAARRGYSRQLGRRVRGGPSCKITHRNILSPAVVMPWLTHDH